MDKIYLQIWELAKPYYQKGRVYDIEQVEWMMAQGDKIAEEIGLNKKLLLPLIILHDVGYSVVGQSNPNIKDQESKKSSYGCGGQDCPDDFNSGQV